MTINEDPICHGAVCFDDRGISPNEPLLAIAQHLSRSRDDGAGDRGRDVPPEPVALDQPEVRP